MDNLKKVILHSATVAWSYVLGLAGLTLDSLDVLAELTGAPDFKQQVSDAIGGDPQWLGRIFLAMAVITFVARLRGLRKKL